MRSTLSQSPTVLVETISCACLVCEEVSKMGKDQHVTPHPNGGWQVKGAGNSRATVRTNTQREALNIGREISRNQGSELVIHGCNGQIRAKDSHGHDPYPPKG